MHDKRKMVELPMFWILHCLAISTVMLDCYTTHRLTIFVDFFFQNIRRLDWQTTLAWATWQYQLIFFFPKYKVRVRGSFDNFPSIYHPPSRSLNAQNRANYCFQSAILNLKSHLILKSRCLKFHIILVVHPQAASCLGWAVGVAESIGFLGLWEAGRLV